MIYQFLALLVVHWIADFVLQTHWQASNKSKNNGALSLHVTVYTWCIGIGAVVIFPINSETFLFALVNGVLHFATDFCTSRVTSRLFMRQFDYIISSFNGESRVAMKRNFTLHDFFGVVGLDQLIHHVTLGLTMVYFFGAQ